MTWAWRIPFERRSVLRARVCAIDPSRLRAVIPTCRDWDDARTTVESILNCRPRPGEIVLVNDNSEIGFPAWARRLPIECVEYQGNRGPAYARNRGALVRSDGRIDWLYFTDTACVRSREFFSELVCASHAAPSGTVGLAAPVVGVFSANSGCPINRYMTEESILSPPFDDCGPQAIVTANAAVTMSAFRQVGGFNVTFPSAAGEDLDLGLRLLQIGAIGWASRAVVQHQFHESRDDFRNRFVRYGAGNAFLELVHGLPSLRVGAIQSRDPRLQKWADLQVRAMQEGYDAVMDSRRGEVVECPNAGGHDH